MAFISPTKARVRSCFLKDVDILQYVNCVRVYESLLKPYLTVHLTVVDNNNLLENMNIVGGEQCTVTFDAPPNDRVYSATVFVLAMQGQQSPNNLKTQIYQIDLIGKTYFQDKTNLVQKGFGQVTGTNAINWVWSNFLGGDVPLKIPVPSIGMMGRKNDTSTIENLKPFAAIEQIKKYLTFASVKTGTPILYRDRDSANLVPLEHLFETLAAEETYIQKETWGANFFDPMIYNAIIVAHAEVEQGTAGSGGRSAMQGIAATVNQGQIVFDMFNGKIVANKIASMVTGGGFSGASIGSLVSGIAGNILSTGPGSLGGASNMQVTHSNRWDRASAPDTKTMEERRYSAEANGGPMLKLKVPLQSGLNATVGKGINAQLMPPVGDLTNFNVFSYGMSGLWLVKNLVHEVYTDNRDVQGTTTMECMKGGLG